MNDEFRKQNRFESVSSLNNSIANLKDSHAILEITSKAFKESITKEKEIFNQLLAMDLSAAPTEYTEASGLTTSPDTFLETEVSVKSYTPKTVDSEDDGEQASIEGILSTENTPIVHST